MPQLLNILGNEVGETSVDVAGGDRVDTGKVAPFVGQGACQVDAAGFGDVIRCLSDLHVSESASGFQAKSGIPVLGESWQCARTWKQ